MLIQPSPPKDLNELMQRAQQLMGKTFAELAMQAGLTLPSHFKRNKGWLGQLIEWHLGADAGSKPHPDFLHLGVELKTIPITLSGMPAETTFVCTVPLCHVQGLTWEKSTVRNKLRQVLWIPIQSDRSIPIPERRIGHPLLWTPHKDELDLLRQDWEEHMEKIALGEIDSISARQGQVLQIRPKAANASKVTDGIGGDGQRIKTLPRGFYLRTQFTHAILRRCLQEI